jgi:hypothetical protein
MCFGVWSLGVGMYYPHHHHSTRQYDHLFVQQPKGIAQNAASMLVMHTQMKILRD